MLDIVKKNTAGKNVCNKKKKKFLLGEREKKKIINIVL